MVTTFSPPVKPKKKKQPIMPIVLGVVAVAAVILAVVLNSKLGKQTKVATQLQETTTQISESLGVAAATPELLADPATAPDALKALASAVAAQKSIIENTARELEAAKAETTTVREQLTAAETKATEAQGAIDSANREVAARRNEVVALQKKYDDDTARLNAEIRDLKLQLNPEADVSEEVTEEISADASEEAEGEPVADAIQQFEVAKGTSDYFKGIEYSAASGKLVLTAKNDQVLTYSGVPETAYNSMIAAPVLDVFFRFQIMDKYESEPNDKEFIRSLNR